MGDYIGKSGIEKSYEKELRGVKGEKIVLVDVFNREKGSFENGLYDKPQMAGQDLITSLDLDLQLLGEKLMMNKRGSIVAIEPSTGEILAIVSSPSYDPNLLVGRVRGENFKRLSQDPLNPLFNRSIQATYSPGSTFK
ncbi:MAG: penicillin-binding protein 2, partial [Bacteroidales bacterium]|nr:penicillin-binding protein 2 [Bacteroidales bacterium]